jgi:hypothetical protein|nr:MAG TPA: hypothetical protein [Caudoviricetes sp.]
MLHGYDIFNSIISPNWTSVPINIVKIGMDVWNQADK